jgi:hypothetical protein
MFGSSKFGEVSFLRQFEPNDDNYLYRKGMSGPPVSVSAAERNAFIETFRRQDKWLNRGFIGSMIGISIIFAILPDNVDRNGTMALVVAVATGLFMFSWLKIHHAPMRLLRSRPTVGPPPSRAELRKITDDVVPWWFVPLVLLFSVPLASKLLETGLTLSVDSLLGLVGVVGTISSLQLAFRKWRSR